MYYNFSQMKAIKLQNQLRNYLFSDYYDEDESPRKKKREPEGIDTYLKRNREAFIRGEPTDEGYEVLTQDDYDNDNYSDSDAGSPKKERIYYPGRVIPVNHYEKGREEIFRMGGSMNDIRNWKKSGMKLNAWLDRNVK